MIEKVVSSGFRVEPLSPRNVKVIPAGSFFVNANPQCGPFPLGKIAMEYEPANKQMIFRAEVADDFVRAQVIPRGRPHFSLLHVALLDDAIASASFTLVTDELYGKRYRYVELGAMACFHREAFIQGSLPSIPRGTIFVDGYAVYWHCLPRNDRIPLLHRGIFRVAVMGLRQGEEVPIASVEGEYFRRKGVLNISQN